MNRRLKKERKKIDKIDQKIFKLIKDRTIVVKKMLILKKYPGATPIRDFLIF